MAVLALDQNDLGTHIGEHHAAEWRRPDPADLYDFRTGKWAHKHRNRRFPGRLQGISLRVTASARAVTAEKAALCLLEYLHKVQYG
jgi:hypothetical protein